MNVRYKRFFLILLALATLTLAACTFPEYEAEFHITSENDMGAYVLVGYTIENVGSKDLYDVVAEIEVKTTSPDATFWGTTSAVDLYIGELESGTIRIDTTGGTYLTTSARVVQIGWNID